MNQEIKKSEKLEVISGKCLNSKLMDSLIDTYQKSTKSAVENILNMCEAVKQIDDKRKANEINDFDVMYFCATVSLDRKSATYRKFRKIGENVSHFRKYINILPSAYTVLFQIATLDAETFNALVDSESITPSLTLERLKQLINPANNSSRSDALNFKVSFDADKLSKKSKESIKQTLLTLYSLNDVEVHIPDKYKSSIGYYSTLSKVQKDQSKSIPSMNTKLNYASAST